MLPGELDEEREPSRTGRSERSLGQVLHDNGARPSPITGEAPAPSVPPPAPPAAPAPPDRRLVLGLSVGVAVLLIALLGVVFGGADEGDRAARLYLAEAEVLLDEGRTEQALDMLQNAEEAGAKDPEVVVAISRLRSRLNPGQN
jgi:hypothetical protein